MRIKKSFAIQIEEKYLRQCCKDGLHAWGPSASDQYEICTRSWCDAVRKKEVKENATKTK